MKRHIVAAALSACLAGCSTAPVSIDERVFFADPPDGAVLAQVPPGCGVTLRAIEDRRGDRTIVGNLDRKPVQGPADGRQWARNALEGLTRYHIAVGSGEQAPRTDIEIRAVLVKSWVSSITTSGTANIVMSVDYTHRGAARGERTYRGNATRMFWAANEAEVRNIVDAAFAELLKPVGRDLAALCRTGVLPSAG